MILNKAYPSDMELNALRSKPDVLELHSIDLVPMLSCTSICCSGSTLGEVAHSSCKEYSLALIFEQTIEQYTAPLRGKNGFPNNSILQLKQ